MYKEVSGNLITLAKQGAFDVIAHGCNCFCAMGAGIAPQMAKEFNVNLYLLERKPFEGDMGKLGQIEWRWIDLKDGDQKNKRDPDHTLAVVNCYTQFGFGRNHEGGSTAPIDYEALTLCMRKMNYEFQGRHIGLPAIGSGLAGGDWPRIKKIIQDEFYFCDVTVVIFDQAVTQAVSTFEKRAKAK